MDNLDFLEELNLIQDGCPIPLKGPPKIVKAGVIFQQFCRNGLRYDIAVSWLQKAVRRGLVTQALYCAYQMNLGKIFVSHLLNRLMIIVSEDIGPAESGLVAKLGPMYRSLYQDRTDTDRLYQGIIYMVKALTASRKSRITDLLIHQAEKRAYDRAAAEAETETEPPKLLKGKKLQVSKAMKKQRALERAVQAAITMSLSSYTCKTVIQGSERRSVVYRLWKKLLDESLCEPYEEDVNELYQIYTQPQFNRTSGLLFLIHAVCLVNMEVPASGSTWEDVIMGDSDEWDEMSSWKFPILNSAVDMHTYYGRRYLGRDSYDFHKHGSKCKNWTPILNERKLREEFIESSATVYPVLEPRGYQTELIKKSADLLAKTGEGWLVMACGTGKTSTSYWLKRELLNHTTDGTDGSYLVVIVLPLLGILKQFMKVWQSFNAQYQNVSVTGIMASSHDAYHKSEFTNYEYLRKASDITSFMKFKAPHKYIFTTYQSLRTKLGQIVATLEPNLVVFDEAHHAKYKHIQMFKDKGGADMSTPKRTKILYLTATPNYFITSSLLLGNYGFRQAINDGMLTDYKVHVVKHDHTQGIFTMLEKCNKLIVYSRNNMISENLMDMFVNEQLITEDYVECYMVTCKTPMKERARIYKAFKDNEKVVIFNCSVLGEGIDFPCCDGVFLSSGYTSRNRVIQAVGRPLRLFTGKTKAHIYMPNDKNLNKRLSAIASVDPEYDASKLDILD